jgi:hypothetical protein
MLKKGTSQDHRKLIDNERASHCALIEGTPNNNNQPISTKSINDNKAASVARQMKGLKHEQKCTWTLKGPSSRKTKIKF